MSRYFKTRKDSTSALLGLIAALIGKDLDGKYGSFDRIVLLPKTRHVIRFTEQWITEST